MLREELKVATGEDGPPAAGELFFTGGACPSGAPKICVAARAPPDGAGAVTALRASTGASVLMAPKICVADRGGGAALGCTAPLVAVNTEPHRVH